MTSVLGELPLSYAVLPEGRRCGSASAVHEPSPAGPPYRASSIAPAGPSARATPPRRSPESSAPKQLLAQFGDRLICVRKPWSSSSPNAVGNRHGLASPTTRSSGYTSPLPTWQSASE